MKIRKKYRIAYLMHGARNIGGGEKSIYLLIKHLSREYFSLIVFYSHENDMIKQLREEGIKLVCISLNERITSVYRDEIKKNPLSLLIYIWHLIFGIFEIRKCLKKYQIDILHPHDNLSKIIGGLAAKTAGVKVVAHCHDILNKEKIIEKQLIFYQLVFMNRIIAVSENVRRQFQVWNKIPDKVQTIYNAIDLNLYNPTLSNPDGLKKEFGIDEGDIVIGIVAVFDDCKGHLCLFQAIKKLISEGMKNIVCLVVGDGRKREELTDFVKKEKLQDYIIFLGYRKDIPDILRIIDICIIPSLQESFGMVALEAMAMKTPVIASAVGGLLEVIEEDRTGLLFPKGDSDALCERIRYLMENPDLRRKIGEAGRRTVEEKFDINNNIRKVEALYTDVLKNS